MKNQQNQKSISINIIESTHPYIEQFAHMHNLEIWEVKAFLSEEQLEPYHLKKIEVEYIQQEKSFLTDQDKAFFIAENILNQSGDILHYLSGEAFERMRRDICASSELYISTPTIKLMIVFTDRNNQSEHEYTPYEKIWAGIHGADKCIAYELIEEYKDEILEFFESWDINWIEYEDNPDNIDFESYEEFIGEYDSEYEHYIDWLDDPDFDVDVMDFSQITKDLMSVIIRTIKSR